MRGRVGLSLALAASAYAVAGRRALLGWGASRAEVSGPAPGDGLIVDPVSVSTMAASFDAPPEELWPWLVQMGTDRAGWYSWDIIDNLGRPSATTILPKHQALAVGDRMPASPSGRTWFDVVALEDERHLVLRATWNLAKWRSLVPGESHGRAVLDATWSMDLRPTDDGGTRLVVRGTTTGRPRLLTLLMQFAVLEPGHLMMQSRQFHGLRRRVTPRER